jgi:3-oxoacyl-[acyl-carrier protein] reductase
MLALIGGGGTGIGFACAMSLAQKGFDVMITGRRQEVLSSAAARMENETKSKVLTVVSDHSTTEGTLRIVEAVKTVGYLDVFVSNTGGPKAGVFDELSEDDFIKAHEQLLLYNIRVCKGIIPLLKKSGSGRIINILSSVVKEPDPSLTLSGVYRSAIASLSKTMAKELAPYGITVNNICPSAIMTDRSKALAKRQAELTGKTIEELYEEAAEKIPMKRFQKPEDIGSLCAFLASSAAANITGQTITVDGGSSNYLL